VLSQAKGVPEQFFEMIIFFLAASCCDIPFITDPSMTKARALRDDLLLAAQHGCNMVEVNSDWICNSSDARRRNSLRLVTVIYAECSLLCRNLS
jgi:hypothetical protein